MFVLEYLILALEILRHLKSLTWARTRPSKEQIQMRFAGTIGLVFWSVS